ncbi:ATP-binding cassette domain-containing protein [Candidatus Bipolaricaulota bacterium]
MAEVMLTSVTKQFGDLATVDDITMKIEAGKFTVHVGPFGCGRTTPLRMIAGLERMSDGKAKIGAVL